MVMKKVVSAGVVLMLTLPLFFACSGPPKPIPEEEAVMEALKEVQKGADSRVSYEEFDRLIADASRKFEQLKGIDEKSDCFFNAVNRCIQSYEISKKAWKLRDDATDEKRRVDLDTTLSFSMGFASVSLAKAAECFKKK
jgi:hypothetical protein